MSKKFTGDHPITNPITNSFECSQAFREIWAKNTMVKHERVYMIYLNHRREHIFHELLNIGDYSTSIFDLRTAIQSALNKRAHNIIVAHNHTYGMCKPSKEDINITEKLLEMCQSLQINLLDHIIMTEDSYCSLRDLGYFKQRVEVLK